MTRLIAYIRVSDMGDRDVADASTQTVAQQRAAIAATAAAHGAELVDEVVALNASGGKSWPEPMLAAAIARVDDGEADGIVVYRLDRFGRHLRALEVVERWADTGRVFLSASDSFDATTSSGRMSLRMMMTVARFYWEDTRDRFAVAQNRALERGAHIARTPLGYTRIEGGERSGCLEVDAELGPVISEAFRLAAADGIHAAGDYLAEHIPARRWTTDDTRRLLATRTYLGEVSLGARTVADAHEPLTSPAAFALAQTTPRAKRASADYPLTGIARCAACGAGLVGARQTVGDKSYRRMRCSAVCKLPGGVGSIAADGLEDYVRAELAENYPALTIELGFGVDDVRAAQAELDAAELERARYLADLEVRAIVGDAAYLEGLRVREDAVAAAAQRLHAASSAASHVERLPNIGQLHEPEHFAAALGVIRDAVSVVVSGGRGSVASRVRFEVLDDDDSGAGMVAA